MLDVAGGRVFVAVHDEYYRRTVREFKNKLKLLHPDMTSGQPIVVPAHTQTMHRTGRHPVSHRGGGQARPEPCWRDAYVIPKKRRASAAFRRAQRAFERWKARESDWYAALGLEPPAWGES